MKENLTYYLGGDFKDMLNTKEWLEVIKAIVVCIIAIGQILATNAMRNASVNAEVNAKKIEVLMQKEKQECRE